MRPRFFHGGGGDSSENRSEKSGKSVRLWPYGQDNCLKVASFISFAYDLVQGILLF